LEQLSTYVRSCKYIDINTYWGCSNCCSKYICLCL